MLFLQETENPAPETHEIRKSHIRMTGVSFTVVDQYQDMIYRVAVTMTGNHADAEDILQEVFFKYFRLQPAFESDSHEKAWFLRVTVNECRNLLRSFWKRRRTDTDPELLLQNTAQENPHDSEVLQAVMSLPEKYRIVVYLYYYEDYSVREIAGITLQSESAVAQQLVRARQKLRKKLGGELS